MRTDMRIPDDFTLGVASASFQIEGAVDKDGRSPSIWDKFCDKRGAIEDKTNGKIAAGHYDLWHDDVALLKSINTPAYRFSLAWPRIYPDGKGILNTSGLGFYDRLIDALLEAGIEPWVTLYHWDLPQALQDSIGGWNHPDIANIFADYARTCFQRLGDRVKNWISLNEPWCTSILGYGVGMFAPGIRDKAMGYTTAHNQLRAHAYAASVYHKDFSGQGGQIGLTNNCDWREPDTDFPEDIDAAQRALEFFLGWFADPVYFGDYPAVMRERVGDLLPHFTEADSKLLKGSSDFFGLNHYTTMLVRAPKESEKIKVDKFGNGGFIDDQDVILISPPQWPKTDMGWNITPWGCNRLLHWIDKRYDHPTIYITENGIAYRGQDQESAINDQARIDFVGDYLKACLEARKEGVDLRGYFHWAFMDDFEWSMGLKHRFGLFHVDWNTLKRTPKRSAGWFAELVSKREL